MREGSCFALASKNLLKCISSTFFEVVKKVAPLLLAFPVIFQAGGLMLLCLLMQPAVKHEVRETIKSHEANFEKLFLTHEQFRRMSLDQHELLVDGQMYDIVNILVKGLLVEVTACRDKKEEGLIAAIENFFGNNGKNHNEYPVQILKLMYAVYTLPNNSFQFSGLALKGAAPPAIFGIHDIFPDDVSSPPPELNA